MRDVCILASTTWTRVARWCMVLVVCSLVVAWPSMGVASAQHDIAAQTSFTTHYIGVEDITISARTGDLNNDGALDIVAGNNEQPSLIYFNDKAGGFPTATPFGAANATTSIALGDLN